MTRLSYYSDLLFPSSTVAALQVVKTVAGLQRTGRDARLYLPVPWRYELRSAVGRLARLRAYYGLDDSFRVCELHSPVPLVGLAQRWPLTRRALSVIARGEYGVLCVRNYWHLRMGLARGMRVLYETYWYRAEPERTQRIVRWLVERPGFIGVIQHSDLARRHWVSLGAPAEKVTTVHNGVDEAEIAAAPYAGRDAARAAEAIGADERVILYTGNMGPGKGVESLLELAAHLPEFSFHLVGWRRRRDHARLAGRAQALGLRNVALRPWQPPARIAALLRAADALIVPPTAQPLVAAGRTVLPFKTFQYLASGVAVIAPRLEDTAEVLHHGGNAFLLTPDAPEQNAAAIRTLFAAPELRQRLAAAALCQVRQHTWARRADRIAEFVSARLPGAAPPR